MRNKILCLITVVCLIGATNAGAGSKGNNGSKHQFPIFTDNATLSASQSYIRDLALCELVKPHAPGRNMTMTSGVCKGDTGSGPLPVYNYFGWEVRSDDSRRGLLLIDRGFVNLWSLNIEDYLSRAQFKKLPKATDQASCEANRGQYFPAGLGGETCRYFIAYPPF